MHSYFHVCLSLVVKSKEPITLFKKIRTLQPFVKYKLKYVTFSKSFVCIFFFGGVFFFTDTIIQYTNVMVPISVTFVRLKINTITSVSSFVVAHTYLFSTLHFGMKKKIWKLNFTFWNVLLNNYLWLNVVYTSGYQSFKYLHHMKLHL